jgi:hypothetical protein
MSDMGSLLGRWHQWRAGYSHERRYARTSALVAEGMHDEEDFEHMLMETLEAEIGRLSPQHQLALQHVARSECLGVECILSPRLPENKGQRQRLCSEAQATLRRQLLAAGFL